MTQRKSSVVEKPDSSPPSREKFVRPDASTAAQGGPAHEQEHGAGAPTPEAADENDRAHGYSQDSGYQGSGGYVADAAEPTEEPVKPQRKEGNGHAHSDAEIGNDVQRRLLGERAPRSGRLLVSVGDGAVTLSGEVDDESQRERLLGLVRTVPSVREVRDQLVVNGTEPPN